MKEVDREGEYFMGEGERKEKKAKFPGKRERR
jgi:hypothetical protein